MYIRYKMRMPKDLKPNTLPKFAKKKKKRKPKKQKVPRTIEERKEDVLTMLMELERLEIPKSYEPYQEILTLCNKYIDFGEYAEGVIKLPAYDRHFVYMFPEFQPGKIQAMLKYVGKKKKEV
jgi:hypothetical protein